MRARITELDPEENKLKLGLKQSYFVEGELEHQATNVGEGMQTRDGDGDAPGLDEQMLDMIDSGSEDEEDWREGAAGTPASSDPGELWPMMTWMTRHIMGVRFLLIQPLLSKLFPEPIVSRDWSPLPPHPVLS